MTTIHPSLFSRIGVPPLWEHGYLGKGVTVAVLDTGMVPEPEFSARIVFDRDFTGENNARHKSHYHGTKVAHIICQVAPEAAIANLRVFPSRTGAQKRHVIRALEHCIESFPRYRIINISLSYGPSGCPDGCSLCRAVEQAYRKGMLVIVAAGNAGPKPDTLTCPARATWAIANLATETKEEEKYWSTWKGRLDWLWNRHVTGRIGKEYGTSFSAGYSSGAAALLFSAFPEVDADTLRFAMLEEATALRREKGHETSLKFDRVYARLLRLQQLAAIPGAIITKAGSLRPFVDPF